MKKCVVTLQLGRQYLELGSLTIPSMSDYASRVGADFHLIQTHFYSSPKDFWRFKVWEKFQIRHLLDVFDRVLFVDIDCYISKRCPDIFSEIPFGGFAGCFTNTADDDFRGYLGFHKKNVGISGSSGVFVVDNNVKHLMDIPDDWRQQADLFSLAEQYWIFCNPFWNDVSIRKLSWDYNNGKSGYIFHPAGKLNKTQLIKNFKLKDGFTLKMI